VQIRRKLRYPEKNRVPNESVPSIACKLIVSGTVVCVDNVACCAIFILLLFLSKKLIFPSMAVFIFV
jgi:hypothetical protein